MSDIRNKIILVDDIKANLDQGRNILKAFYEVYPASSAAKLFSYLEKVIPDLILLDIEMPEMNGYEAIKVLKADERYADIPVIFLTAKSDEISEREGFDLGAADYVAKPFSAPRLFKRIENQLLIARQKMDLKAALAAAENASFAKGSFLANMSHEIRTPINAIIGMAGIAAGSDDIEKLKYCLANIEASSAHLLGIVNDILDISKIEAGKFELDATPLNVEKMLIKVCRFVIDKIERKSIAFNITLDPNMNMHYEGDELRLSQVVTNLLSNAVKFTPVDGKIELTVNEIERGGDYCVLRFSVKDTGIGMTGEQVSRLFTAFEQAESSTARKFGGTGLGLVISKNIVEKMDGRIWVESEIGKGSDFIFEVRLRRREKQDDAIVYRNIKPADIKLLFASPDAEIKGHFKAIINSFGMTADEAVNIAQAVDFATTAKQTEEYPYDVVFIDDSLANEKGVDFVRNLRAQTDNVVVMTSFLNWNKCEQELKGVGVNKFMTKPLFPSSILNLINEAIGNTVKTLNITSEQTAEMPDFSDVTLLLAEDVEINREIFTSLLQETKLNIDIAENGRIAVEKFKSDPDRYDMIIMDVQMPEMDGYEATKAIRALGVRNADSIPIIAMTANVFSEDIKRCLDCGMSDHLSKPIEVDAVIRKINFYRSARGNAGGA